MCVHIVLSNNYQGNFKVERLTKNNQMHFFAFLKVWEISAGRDMHAEPPGIIVNDDALPT